MLIASRNAVMLPGSLRAKHQYWSRGSAAATRLSTDVRSAPCPSIARLFLDVLELIDPQKAEPYLLSVATSWSSRADQRFWNELAIGQRVCALAGKAEVQPPAQQWIELADVIAATGLVAGETLKKALRARQ